MSEVGAVLSNANALLVHLKADPLFEITIPSKIQAYLFAGKPILCGVKGDAADLVCRAARDCPSLPRTPTRLRRQFLLCAVSDADGLRLMGDGWPCFLPEAPGHGARVSGGWRRRSSRSWLYRRGASDGRRSMGRVPRAEREKVLTMNRVGPVVKRAIDVIVSAMVLLVFLPVMAFVVLPSA